MAKDFRTMEDSNRSANPSIHEVSAPQRRTVLKLSPQRYDIPPKVAGTLNYEELAAHHVPGRLKVAPEHTSDHVLRVMRKPSFDPMRTRSQSKVSRGFSMRSRASWG